MKQLLELHKNHKDKGIHKNYIVNLYVFFKKKKKQGALPFVA